MAESGRVPRKSRIRASIEKLSRRVTEMGSNLCEYRKLLESGRLPRKGRIRASIEKLSRRSTGKRSNLCEYRKTFPASTGKGSNLCEYRKLVESGRVPRKGRICASIEKRSRRVLEKGWIFVSTEKWQNPGEYREKVESVRVSKNFLGEYWKKGRICVSTENY